MTARRIVVVGNGIAGLTACDSLRAAGFDGVLTIVGAEHHSPYSRPALSKALLHGGDGLAVHGLPGPTHGADELLGISATGLDAEARVVTLDDGGSLPYDGLVIASGSRARRLAGSGGAGNDGQLTLRTLEDAVRLKELVAARPSVIVVGGGPLGMEVASGCLHSGCDVTLVTDGEPLVRQLGSYLSGIFTAAARTKGLRIVNGSKARLIGPGTIPQVALADGTVLEADLLVSAVGDEPNIEWLEGSGLLTGGILRVDSRGRVRPDVVAAGDVAFFPSQRGLGRVPLWTSAIDQAKAAAVGLLRGDEAPPLQFQPYFWTEAFGLSLKAVGFTPVEGAPHVREQGAGADSALLRWEHAEGSGTAAAINYRIPIPRLRRLAATGQQVARATEPVTA